VIGNLSRVVGQKHSAEEKGQLDSPGQVNVLPGPHLAYI